MSFETISLLLNWMEMGALLAILFRLSSTFNLIANTQRELRRAIYHLGERRGAELGTDNAFGRPGIRAGFPIPVSACQCREHGRCRRSGPPAAVSAQLIGALPLGLDLGRRGHDAFIGPASTQPDEPTRPARISFTTASALTNRRQKAARL